MLGELLPGILSFSSVTVCRSQAGQLAACLTWQQHDTWAPCHHTLHSSSQPAHLAAHTNMQKPAQAASQNERTPSLLPPRRSSSSAMVVREAAAILNKVSTAASAASEPSPSAQPGSPKGLFRRGSSLNSEVRRRAALGAAAQQQSSAGGVQLRSTTSSNGGADGPQMLPLPSSSGSPPLPVSSSAVDDQELGVSRSVHDAGLLVLPSLEREWRGDGLVLGDTPDAHVAVGWVVGAGGVAVLSACSSG
jgi:hypothetical protein